MNLLHLLKIKRKVKKRWKVRRREKDEEEVEKIDEKIENLAHMTKKRRFNRLGELWFMELKFHSNLNCTKISDCPLNSFHSFSSFCLFYREMHEQKIWMFSIHLLNCNVNI